MGVPLRHGGVIAGSEQVTLNGRRLKRGDDYSMDNDAGIVYLLCPNKPGQSVSVSYRYEPSRSGVGEPVQAGSLVPMRMNFGSGNSIGMTLGLGLAERTTDGQVLSTNIFGWNNNFNLGGNSLNGLMLVGERTQQNAKSAFEYQANNMAPGQGKSHLIMQSLAGVLGGGKFKLDYQDISGNFGGFSAVRANGYSSDVANQMAKEKGLKRLGFSMDNVQLGGLGFSNSYRTVGNEKGGIKWSDFGINAGSLTLNYKSQQVGERFDRFNDLAETNREQLAREAGLTRQAMDVAWKLGFGALSYSTSAITDTASKGINRTDLKFTGSKFNFNMGNQVVEQGFNRFSSLNDVQAGQWGREVGLKRNWMAFDALAFGAGSQPLKFSQYSIDSPSGGIENLDASAGGSKWSFEHIKRNVDRGFTALPNLTPQEIGDNMAAISKMYVKGGVPITGDMAGFYLQSPGLSRDFTRVNFKPSSGWDFGFESLKMQGIEDGGRVNNLSLSGAGVNLAFREQKFGEKFNELTRLMQFEQQRLGTLAGLDRTDFSVKAKMRGGSNLAFNNTNAETANGGLDRHSLSYTDRTMQLNVNHRKVGPNFNAISQLLDPEAGMLAQMIGFNQTDYSFKWQAMPNLFIDAASWDGFSDTLNQRRMASNLLVNWGPAKGTQFQFQRTSSDSNNPLDLLLANLLQRMSFNQDFGKAGVLRYTQQEMNFAGTQSSVPSNKMSDLSYEAKLSGNTNLKTQLVNTDYADGNSEKVQSHTINTELTKRAGLSLTNTTIARSGAAPDEKKTNMGFWVNLWNGVRLNVGVNDGLNNTGSSVTQHTVSLTPGTIGNMQVGSANYAANTWEQGNRTQANSNISLSSVKPFNLGFFKELKFNIGQDTAADNGAWLKENKSLAFSGKVGSNAFGFNYFSQMNNLQQRGVDRTFTFATAQSTTAKLRANLIYKQRTLPDNTEIAMRNFSIIAQPWKDVLICNEMVTNPELPRGDVLLGSMPQPMRVNKWKLDYLRDPNFKISGTWEEQRNDDTDMLSRMGGVTFTMFEKSGSPVSLFLGVEQTGGGQLPRHLANRWALRFDQKPGPNQALSLFIGNITYGGTLNPGEKARGNLSADIQYQYRFK
jgi:hypothetical protein